MFAQSQRAIVFVISAGVVAAPGAASATSQPDRKRLIDWGETRDLSCASITSAMTQPMVADNTSSAASQDGRSWPVA